MTGNVARIAAITFEIGSLAGLGYYLACLWSARWYLRDRMEMRAAEEEAPAPSLPPVSILKPLKGEDPEIYASFRTHCLQHYPEYEIVFGVSDPEDPALDAVERLRQEFPAQAIQVIVCREVLGANTKVSNLAQMVKVARYETLVVSDSDIRVPRDYLRRVIAPLEDEKVGMVTCLYRGISGETLGSRLESLGISTDFCASVLVARSIEGGIRFGLGSTMAFRRDDLDAIGGFGVFVDYLADDYELGKRIAELGKEIRLSDVVVETFLPSYDRRGFFEHQLRWARGVRGARPGGYLGLIFTFGWQWAMLALVASGGPIWAWRSVGMALLLRILVALMVGLGVLEDRQALLLLPLVPLRDAIAVGVWIASFLSDEVTWRGDRFQLDHGKLIRLEAQS
jgi:ceramide glucosyltransferase